MGERSFAGFTYRRRLGNTFYGEVHRAHDAQNAVVGILHVAPALATKVGFAEKLSRFGSELALLNGDHVVTTRTVGRTDAGDLVVVTDDGDGLVSAEQLLAQARGGLPSAISMSLAHGLVEALAIAHGTGIVHGAVHPRSLLVDDTGAVKLADFAVGRARTSLAVQTDDDELFGGFRVFLAPELALGEEPSPSTDVYAVGALLYSMFGGDVTSGAQPGRLKATTSIRRLVMRAMDTDESRRFSDAVELRKVLADALSGDEVHRASTQELAMFTDDVRDSGGIYEGGAPPPLPPAGVDDLNASMDDLLSDLADDDVAPPPSEDEPTAVEPSSRRSTTGSAGVDDMLAALSEEKYREPDPALDDEETNVVDPPLPREVTDEIGDDSQLTQVDDNPPITDVRDPISELIQLDRDASLPPDTGSRLHLDTQSERDDHTPLPEPIHEDNRPGTLTRAGEDILRGTGQRKEVASAADDAIAALEAELDGRNKDEASSRRQRRAKSRMLIDETELVSDIKRRRIPVWFWMLFTLAGLGLMFYLVWTQSDVFHPDRRAAKERQREIDDKQEQADFHANQKKGGEMFVESNVEGASVWLKLGRTPLDSMPLPVFHPHQIRVQLDGHKVEDLIVVAADWKGDRATITATLKLADAGYEVPARLPAPPASARRGYPESLGRGVIHVESKPGGAEVWLLVGYTNTTHMKEFQAGAKYEFKLLKNGYRPSYGEIKAADWKVPGHPDPLALRRKMILELPMTPLPDSPKKP